MYVQRLNLAQKMANFKYFPRSKLIITNIGVEIISESDSKSLELGINSIQVEKSFKGVEIVEIGHKAHRRAKKQKNKFEQKWTCESMCAYERSCLSVAVNDTSLKRFNHTMPITPINPLFERHRPL